MNNSPEKKGSTESKDSTKNAKSTKGTKNPDPKLMELFIDEIKDIYWAEKHLTKALPKMAKACTNEELASSILNHLEETKIQVTRLEKIFEILGEKAQAKKCDAMEGLVSEGESIIEETETGSSTRDVGIIMASQKVEHYEIATYGCLVQLSKVLGLNEVESLFAQTLEEEKNADSLLTEIAESKINYGALQEN